MKILTLCSAFLGVLFCGGCAKVPAGASPVTGFELDRYLGTWYEVARLDHSFERGLTQVNATYSLNADGTVRVLNRGYDPAKQEWREAIGKAKFVGDPQVGQLKVSFFGPFYGGYNILALDPDYGYSLVCGPSLTYLWLLSRERYLPPDVQARLIEQARGLGFPVEQLILVPQDGTP